MAKQVENLATQSPALVDTRLIGADKKWNVRLRTDGIEELAADIKARGLISPITIRQISDKKYGVVIGFRRFAAMKLLGYEQVPATLFTGDEQAALLLNLSENVQRKDLSTYEVALRCSMLKDAPHNMSAVAIASTLGKSKTYVENLIRSLKNLADPILKAWANPDHASNSLCTTNQLNLFAAMEHEMQLAAWDELRGHTPKDATDNDGLEKPEKPVENKRPGKAKLIKAIEVIKLAQELTDVEVGAMVIALRWASGLTKTISKSGTIIYDPAKKKNEDVEAD